MAQLFFSEEVSETTRQVVIVWRHLGFKEAASAQANCFLYADYSSSDVLISTTQTSRDAAVKAAFVVFPTTFLEIEL